MTMHLFGVTEDGLSILVRAGGLMPYVYFQRPRRWPDQPWRALVHYVEQYVRKHIDARCTFEPAVRKSLFNEHYMEMSQFVRVNVSNAHALQQTIKWLSRPLRDGRVSLSAFGPECLEWQGMSEDGVQLDLFEDGVDLVTHFLADYGLQAGGWVRVLAGQYVLVADDACQDACQLGRAWQYTNTPISTCSLEVCCRLAVIGEGLEPKQPLLSCSRPPPTPPAPSTLAGGSANREALNLAQELPDTCPDTAKWARSAIPVPPAPSSPLLLPLHHVHPGHCTRHDWRGGYGDT
jgi:hypothetical protein